jgi:hypothetical protein
MVSVADNVLAISLNQAGNKDWGCSNKRGTKTTDIFGVIPWWDHHHYHYPLPLTHYHHYCYYHTTNSLPIDFLSVYWIGIPPPVHMHPTQGYLRE